MSLSARFAGSAVGRQPVAERAAQQPEAGPALRAAAAGPPQVHPGPLQGELPGAESRIADLFWFPCRLPLRPFPGCTSFFPSPVQLPPMLLSLQAVALETSFFLVHFVDARLLGVATQPTIRVLI